MIASAAGVRLAGLRRVAAALVVAGLAGGCAPGPSPSALAQQSPPPVDYRLSFPAPAHRWLAAEVRFDDVGEAPLHVRMSSASPGRYARHEFAKNLIEIAFTTSSGGPSTSSGAAPRTGRSPATGAASRSATASSATASTAPTWPSTRPTRT